MRLSEKTIEINFCTQLAKILPYPIVWFGLTQKQEARAGFDVCSKIGGQLLIFQFKASNNLLKRTQRRRFYLPHDQLTNLQSRVGHHRRFVFYVFPLIGSTMEFSRNFNIVTQSRFLDVARIPSLPPPTTKSGTLRKTRIHYADVNRSSVILHSDPIELKLTDPFKYAKRGFADTDGINEIFENSFQLFWEFARGLPRNTLGAVIDPAGRGWRSA